MLLREWEAACAELPEVSIDDPDPTPLAIRRFRSVSRRCACEYLGQVCKNGVQVLAKKVNMPGWLFERMAGDFVGLEAA